MFAANAQVASGDYLDINNIKAKINSNGVLFTDSQSAQFEVPKGSGKNTIFTSGLWIGGFDYGGQLKMAGQTYQQTGTDFFSGPIDPSGIYAPAYNAAWNRVWKINKCAIDVYHNWVVQGSAGVNPLLSGSAADSAALEVIMHWPAFDSIGQPIAPFVDVLNDGIYNPSTGDVPLIKGDQAIYFIYNDDRAAHTETGGAKLGVEIRGMAYAYSCSNNDALYNTIFTNYKIINKTPNRIDSVFIGNFTDFDIGYYNDDYIGSDVTRGAFYGYNGDSIDGSGQSGQYGATPPAQAVVFLNGPFADPNGVDDAAGLTPNGTNYGDGIIDNERLGMSKFISFNNNSNSINGEPVAAADYYKYSAGTWKNGTHLTYGGNGTTGSVPASYLFPGNSDPNGYGTNMNPQQSWDETTAAILPGDVIGIGASGPFSFVPGAEEELDFAYVYGRATSGNNLASVVVMKNRIDSVRQKFYTGIVGCSCTNTLAGIDSKIENKVNLFLYPNPAKDNISITYATVSKNVPVEIFNATGELVKQTTIQSAQTIISVADFAKGLYILKIQDGTKILSKKFLKE